MEKLAPNSTEMENIKTVELVETYVLPKIAQSEPSFTRLRLAYDVVCRRRFSRAIKQQKRQFVNELIFFEMMQGSALDGVRVHREFSNGILSHKIPSKNYMNRLTVGHMTPKQQARLEDIMTTTHLY